MKASDSTASHETREEQEGPVLKDETKSETKQEGSQELDCESNCLTGIKWPPDQQVKNERKKRGVINGFRKIKTGIVTHGGRTSKLPARFMETDSENETLVSKKHIHSRKDDHETSGERSSTCSTSKICKNGRTEPLEQKPGKITKRKRKSKLYSEDDMDAAFRESGVQSINSSYPPSKTGLSPSGTLSRSLKRNFCNSHSETESSSEETLPRKRGRPPKSAVKIPNVARGKAIGSCVSVSPHGDCVVSATNAPLTSPNLKPKKKKRKLLNGLRSASIVQGISSDDSSSECSSPKKRGRPPKAKHLSLSGTSESKLHEFGSKNGVRKPWVRPVLKSLHKRAIFRSHEEHLDNLLGSSEKHMTKVKAKLAKINGFSVDSRECTNGDLVKRKRGRPPKIDSMKKCKLKKDVFSFTDEEDLDSSSFNGRLKKLKKLKKMDKSKLGKRPLAASKVNKTEKLLADKLRKNAIKRAKQSFSASEKKTKISHDPLEKDNTDSLQSRRRRNKVDRVLGMRLNTLGQYEYLVQWKDGTSCWTSSDQAADYELDLKSFLGHDYQEFCSVNRLVFKAYFHDNLDKFHRSLKVPESEVEECHSSDHESGHDDDNDDDDIFSDADDIFDNRYNDSVEEEVKPKKRGRKKQDCNIDKEFLCKEVTVQKLQDCVHITVRRSSGKQMRVNLRIIDSLTLALEDAAVDQSDTVVISGLGDDIFCGVDLDTIVTIPLEGEVKNYRKDVDKIRYLIQTIQYFPKPVIATISKPAEGLGAQLVALCDMVCDKAALGDPVNLALAKANGTIPYCFPRLMGHATVSEHVLMGEPLSSPITDWRDSLSDIFKSAKFTSELLTSVEAMTHLPPCLRTSTALSDRIGNCSSEEEQRLTREVDSEKNKVQDSLKELMAFWENVTAKVS